MTEPMSHEVALRIITELKAIREQWRSQLGGQDPDELKELSQALDRAIERFASDMDPQIDRAIDRFASDMDPKEVLREMRKLGGLEGAAITLEGLPEDLR
jgi:hypothetical protein